MFTRIVYVGGKLELGDIEDIDGQICVSCPRHRYPFQLVNGQCIVSSEYDTQTYIVRKEKNGQLYIGFENISSSVFEGEGF